MLNTKYVEPVKVHEAGARGAKDRQRGVFGVFAENSCRCLGGTAGSDFGVGA